MRGVRVRGRIYNRSKGKRGGDRRSEESKSQTATLKPTADSLGEKHGVSRDTIIRDGKFAEKVEIARRIEEALGKRHGNNQHGQKEDVQKFAPADGKSRDLAAESVGWSGETYRKAKAVVDSGPQLKK